MTSAIYKKEYTPKYLQKHIFSFSYNGFKGRLSQCQENSGLCAKGPKGKSMDLTFLTYIYNITAFSPFCHIDFKNFLPQCLCWILWKRLNEDIYTDWPWITKQ